MSQGKPAKRQRRRKQEGGFALVLVASVLMVLTVLGLSAVMFSTGEIEGTATQTVRDRTRYCAELATAHLVSRLSDPSKVNSPTIASFDGGNSTMAEFKRPGVEAIFLPTGEGSQGEFHYWVGHYGQIKTPMLEVKSSDDALQQLLSGGKGNIMNVRFGGGGKFSSTTRLFQSVVTCRAPAGYEVELQSLIKIGL